MDEFVRKNGAVRNQYGVLGSDNRDGTYCDPDECGLLDTEKISFIRRQFIAIEPLESSFLIHKAMRFDSKGGRIPDVISDNYEKLAPSADTRLRVNRSGSSKNHYEILAHIT